MGSGKWEVGESEARGEGVGFPLSTKVRSTVPLSTFKILGEKNESSSIGKKDLPQLQNRYP